MIVTVRTQLDALHAASTTLHDRARSARLADDQALAAVLAGHAVTLDRLADRLRSESRSEATDGPVEPVALTTAGDVLAVLGVWLERRGDNRHGLADALDDLAAAVTAVRALVVQ